MVQYHSEAFFHWEFALFCHALSTDATPSERVMAHLKGIGVAFATIHV